MARRPPRAPDPEVPIDPREAALIRSMDGFFDAGWYLERYPDIAGAGLTPVQHFIRHGLTERRDPNPFFDSAWYAEHYPDVGVSGLHPLLHYLQSGASERRNPHPHFDATWYVEQYPDAAANPLVYHVRTGLALGHLTEKPIDIQDYLPSALAPSRAPGKIVDVVIPVYRGLADTQRCLRSVLADRGRPLGRVIVVEDRSPDPDLVAWLMELAASGLIELVRNPRNVGFVASVNRGMAAAGKRDVVLLNSDTEVPAGWLGRLAAQAYAAPRIATVSPLSNNATICGYPDNYGGPIAFGHFVSDVDGICRSENAGRWVDTPTTVGFCMYIRRAALRQVGDFDAARFTVGYGEENDFCLRATDRGWRHRIACDTFVYHQGSVSFGDRVKKLEARAMKLILERYPDYARDVGRHVNKGDSTPIRFAVTAGLFRQSGLPVILMVTHDLGGGVQRHIDRLVQRYADSARFLLLQATDRGAALSVPALPKHPSLSLPAERLDDLVMLLRSMAVSRVHIHHLLGMDMDVRRLIHRLGVPFDVTVHDYYAICPQINLLPWQDSLYCGEPDIAGCNTCIAHRGSHGARDIVTWRAESAWQFRDAQRVFCPSNDVVSRLRRYGVGANAVLAPHEPVVAGAWKMRAPPPVGSRLRIAVLGVLADHKGGRTVAALAGLADPKRIEIHLIGRTEALFPDAALKRMKVTGPYDDADLPGLIETIAPHVIWFPAVWPETFSYTLSAAIDAGLPIAGTRIGAHAERLQGRPRTWLSDVATSPMAWLELFETIRQEIGKPIPKAPARPVVADIYASDYLRPRAAPRARSRPTRPRIAVVPERFNIGVATPCAYIRLLQPLHHPAAAPEAEVIVTDASGVLELTADVIVTQRSALEDVKAVDRLAEHARRHGARLVFDLDDDLLTVPRSHPDAAALRPQAKVVRRLLDVADQVWLSTPGLAQRLATIRPDSVLMENRLDERIWTRPPPPSEHGPVRVLCMGTNTHDGDFALIAPVLSRLKAEHGDRVRFDIVGMTGHRTLEPGLNRVGPSANAGRSYPGFVEWLTSVRPRWDIGLAPLLDTPFNKCKSAIKAMDYAALGLAVLASDVPAYRGSIADGPAGRLVENTASAWHAALDWLIRNRELRHATACRARLAFEAGGCLAPQADTRRAAWLRLLDVARNRAA